MELIYFYSVHNKNISERGYNLHNEYYVDDFSGINHLEIKKRDNYIENFFSSNINCLKLIIGDNGSGKTTLLNSLSLLICEGNDYDKVGAFDFFLIYKYEKNIFAYALGDLSFEVKYEGKLIEKVDRAKWKEHLRFLSNFYYSQHLDKLYSTNLFDKLSEEKTKGRFDLSTIFQYRSIIRNLSGSIPNEINITNEFIRQEYLRFLKLANHGNVVEFFKVPKYFMITFEPKGSNSLIDEFLVDIIKENRMLEMKSEKKIERYIFSSFLNSIYKDNYLDYQLLKNELQSEGTLKLDDTKLLIIIGNHLKNDEDKQKQIVCVSLLKFLLKKVDKNLFVNKYYLNLPISNKNYHSTLEKINKIGLLTHNLDFVSIKLSYDGFNDVNYSSGEYTILGLFSRLFDKKIHFRKHNLILLDEAEISLHPKWQRKFIYQLVSFLELNFPFKKFQIILTSHSPMMLSDMPYWAVSKLTNDGDEQNIGTNTFGANIHELYGSDFGLGDNLIGEFASKKIKEIVKKITEGDNSSNYKELRSLINLIGEPFIKYKLGNQLNQIYQNEKIDELIQQKVEELEKLKALKKR